MGRCEYKEKWMKCSSHRVGNTSYHKTFEGINFKWRQLAMFHSLGVATEKTKNHVTHSFCEAEYPSGRGVKDLKMHIV